MIILNKKSYLKKNFFYNNLDRNIIMIVNNIKYNNNKLNFYQLKYFNKNIQKKKYIENIYNR